MDEPVDEEYGSRLWVGVREYIDDADDDIPEVGGDPEVEPE